MKKVALGLFILLLSSCKVMAQESFEWLGKGDPSIVIIQDTDSPGAIAEVIFNNESNHPQAKQSIILEFKGLEVEILVETNTRGSDDTLTVIPPEGYYSFPSEEVVPEDSSTTILIMEGGLS